MNWSKILKWVGGGLVGIVLLVALFAGLQIFLFDRMMDEVLERPEVRITASSDSAVIARGRHVAEALGSCLGCHGPDLGGAPSKNMGPVGIFIAPNLTRGAGGVGDRYTDEQLAKGPPLGERPNGGP